MFKKISRSLICGFIVSVMLLLIFAFILFVNDMSGTIVSVFVFITYFISNLVAGFCMGKSVDRNKYVWGLLIGLTYFSIVFLIAIIGSERNAHIDASMLIGLGVSTLGGMVGGMIS